MMSSGRSGVGAVVADSAATHGAGKTAIAVVGVLPPCGSRMVNDPIVKASPAFPLV